VEVGKQLLHDSKISLCFERRGDAIAALHQNENSQDNSQQSSSCSLNRVDMNAVRKESAIRQAAKQEERARRKAAPEEEMRMREDEKRTPDEWHAKLSQKNIENNMKESEINMQQIKSRV